MNQEEFEKEVKKLTNLEEIEKMGRHVRDAFATGKIDSATYERMARIVVDCYKKKKSKLSEIASNKNNINDPER